MEQTKSLSITIMKLLFFISGIFIIILQLQFISFTFYKILTTFNYVFDFTILTTLNYIFDINRSYYEYIVFFCLIFLISLTVYFINFYFLQKIIKKEKILINGKIYKYTNTLICITLIYSLVLALSLVNIVIIENTNILILLLILFTIIYLLFHKVSKIINSFELLHKENIKTTLQSSIIKKSFKILVIIFIITSILFFLFTLFLPIKRERRMAMCHAVFREEERTTPLKYLIDVNNEKQDCKKNENIGIFPNYGN